MKICELANNEKQHFDILYNKMISSMSKKKRIEWIESFYKEKLKNLIIVWGMNILKLAVDG